LPVRDIDAELLGEEIVRSPHILLTITSVERRLDALRIDVWQRTPSAMDSRNWPTFFSIATVRPANLISADLPDRPGRSERTCPIL
jgi:hypothetical protein